MRHAHPYYFHAARKDRCPDIAKVTCPDCGAKLHFDPKSIERKSYGSMSRPINAIGGPQTYTPRGLR